MKIIISFILLFIFWGILPESIQAQNFHKFRAKFVSTKEYKDYGGWDDWSEWSELNYLITIDLDDGRVSIFANEQINFDIIDYDYDETSNRKTIYLKTIDDYGVQCRIRFVYDEVEEDRQLYVDYENFIVVYSLKALTSY